MKNGYKLLWTANALKELHDTFSYLETNFSDKELNQLANKMENIAELISKNPNIYPISKKKNVHRVVILKYNTMYYKVENRNIIILSFFPIGNRLIKENCSIYALSTGIGTLVSIMIPYSVTFALVWTTFL
jgi:plasmid stabilization system protein ParE